jgi:hypothetical protein
VTRVAAKVTSIAQPIVTTIIMAVAICSSLGQKTTKRQARRCASLKIVCTKGRMKLQTIRFCRQLGFGLAMSTVEMGKCVALMLNIGREIT